MLLLDVIVLWGVPSTPGLAWFRKTVVVVETVNEMVIFLIKLETLLSRVNSLVHVTDRTHFSL